jgi:hypothetical protein
MKFTIPLMLPAFSSCLKGIFIFCLLHFCIHTLESQQNPDFISSFNDRPHLTFELASRNQNVVIRNPDAENIQLTYRPNTRTNLLACIDYRWLSLSLGLISFQSSDGDRKGESKQFSFRASFNGRRFWNSNFLQIFNGYYLTNPQVANPSFNSQSDFYPTRPDLKTTTFFSNLFYCFNPDKFSYRASLYQLDRQERSAGSFIAGLSLRMHRMLSDPDQTLIPNELESQFKPEYRLISQSVTNFNFNVGYVHTLVYKHSWFLTLYFVPGISIQNSYSLSEDKQIRNQQNKATSVSEFRFILGYNGDNWYSGISSYNISFAGKRDLGVWVDDNYSWFRMFVGYRFKSVDRTHLPEWRKKIQL